MCVIGHLKYTFVSRYTHTQWFSMRYIKTKPSEIFKYFTKYNKQLFLSYLTLMLSNFISVRQMYQQI